MAKQNEDEIPSIRFEPADLAQPGEELQVVFSKKYKWVSLFKPPHTWTESYEANYFNQRQLWYTKYSDNRTAVNLGKELPHPRLSAEPLPERRVLKGEHFVVDRGRVRFGQARCSGDYYARRPDQEIDGFIYMRVCADRPTRTASHLPIAFD